MGFVIKPPKTREFALPKDLLEKYGESDGEAHIAIRPASFAENSKREERFSRFKRVVRGDGEALLESEINLAELFAYEIYLTLAECDIEIEDEDGKTHKLFRFRNERINMTFEQFRNALGQVPDEIVMWIHDRVIEVNPHWGPEGKGS